MTPLVNLAGRAQPLASRDVGSVHSSEMCVVLGEVLMDLLEAGTRGAQTSYVVRTGRQRPHRRSRHSGCLGVTCMLCSSSCCHSRQHRPSLLVVVTAHVIGAGQLALMSLLRLFASALLVVPPVGVGLLVDVVLGTSADPGVGGNGVVSTSTDTPITTMEGVGVGLMVAGSVAARAVLMQLCGSFASHAGMLTFSSIMGVALVKIARSPVSTLEAARGMGWDDGGNASSVALVASATAVGEALSCVGSALGVALEVILLAAALHRYWGLVGLAAWFVVVVIAGIQVRLWRLLLAVLAYSPSAARQALVLPALDDHVRLDPLTSSPTCVARVSRVWLLYTQLIGVSAALGAVMYAACVCACFARHRLTLFVGRCWPGTWVGLGCGATLRGNCRICTPALPSSFCCLGVVLPCLRRATMSPHA